MVGVSDKGILLLRSTHPDAHILNAAVSDGVQVAQHRQRLVSVSRLRDGVTGMDHAKSFVQADKFGFIKGFLFCKSHLFSLRSIKS